MSQPLEERDFIIIEDPTYDVIEVTDAPPGSKGDPGIQGPMGPGLPITFSRRGTATVSDGRMKYRFPFDCTIVGCSAAMGVGTPPTGSDLTYDIKVNGSVVVSMVIPDGSEDAPEVPLAIPVLVGDYATVNITQVGSVDPGDDLSIFIRYEV